MAKLSVSVMAHQARAHLVDELVDRLGVDADRVTWDRRQDRWDTGRRAMLDHDPDSDWHMVIQDDAMVCRDLLPGLEAALDRVPAGAISCPYVGTRRPMTERVTRAVEEADRAQASWIVLQTLNWGVAIIVPTNTIAEMVAWCDRLTIPNYDKRVGQYYWRVRNWPTWYTHPSLVDHRDVPSLAGHGPDRRAHRFAGEDTSALDLSWDGERVMALDWLSRRRRVETPPAEGTIVWYRRIGAVGAAGAPIAVTAGSRRDRILAARPRLWARYEEAPSDAELAV